MSDEAKLWYRQPGEPMRWYARFEAYRLMGATRSLLGAYKQERAKTGKGGSPRRTPRSWDEAAHLWGWKRRAEAWDAYEQEQVRQEYEEARRADKEQRLLILKGYRAKLIEALKALTPLTAEWKDVTAGLQMVMREIRLEYGEEPEQQQTGPVDVVLHWADTPKPEEPEKPAGEAA